MAYDENLADRIREHLVHLPAIEEKEMMGGIVFMYNEKMCAGVMKDELLCRINPAIYEEALDQNGCRTMEFTNRPMKGWVLVDQEAIKSKEGFLYWINLALDFNAKARKSKKKSPAPNSTSGKKEGTNAKKS